MIICMSMYECEYIIYEYIIINGHSQHDLYNNNFFSAITLLQLILGLDYIMRCEGIDIEL